MGRPRCLVILLLVALALDATPVASGRSEGTSKSAQVDFASSSAPVATVFNGEPQAVAQGAQTIIVFLVQFPDSTGRISADKVHSIMRDMDRFFSEASYGLAWVEATVIDRWYQVQTPLSKLDIQKWSYDDEDMDKFHREAIKAVDSDVNFREYKFLIIVAAGGVWPHASCDFGVSTDDGTRQVRGFVVNVETQIGTYIHELGHVLPTNLKMRDGCGLPDLYSYDAMEKDEDASIWVGPWDLMDVDSSPRQFSAWSKIALGWLTPEEIHLKPTTAVVVSMQPLEKESGSRAVVVSLTSKTSYVVEVRRRIGYDKALPGEGVLIYSVDLTKDSGHGIVKVVDGKPKTKTLDDAPFKKGDIFEDDKNKVYVLVALTDGVGFSILVSGTRVESLKDTDQDGLLDSIEAQLGTDPKKPDTDSDGLEDGEEVNQYGTDALKADTDEDGLSDGREVQLGTDALRADSDNDGLTDVREVQLGTNPKIADTDGDGVKDDEEVNQYGTSPLKADTDSDGLADREEIRRGTDPLKSDTDNDDLSDGREIQLGTGPLKPDSDGDELPDGREIQVGTNPLSADTDGDFWRDNADPTPTNPLIPNVLLIIPLVAIAVTLIVIRKRKRSSVISGTARAATAVRETVQFCTNCGLPIPVGSNFCEKCGAQQ